MEDASLNLELNFTNYSEQRSLKKQSKMRNIQLSQSPINSEGCEEDAFVEVCDIYYNISQNEDLLTKCMPPKESMGSRRALQELGNIAKVNAYKKMDKDNGAKFSELNSECILGTYLASS
jgi:hypothetical protein